MFQFSDADLSVSTAQNTDPLKKLIARRTAKKGSITKRINELERLVSEGASRTKVRYLLSSLLDVSVSLQEVCEEISLITQGREVQWHVANEEWLETEKKRVDACAANVNEYLEARRDDPASTASFTDSWVKKHAVTESSLQDAAEIEEELLCGAAATSIANASHHNAVDDTLIQQRHSFDGPKDLAPTVSSSMEHYLLTGARPRTSAVLGFSAASGLQRALPGLPQRDYSFSMYPSMYRPLQLNSVTDPLFSTLATRPSLIPNTTSMHDLHRTAPSAHATTFRDSAPNYDVLSSERYSIPPDLLEWHVRTQQPRREADEDHHSTSSIPHPDRFQSCLHAPSSSYHGYGPHASARRSVSGSHLQNASEALGASCYRSQHTPVVPSRFQGDICSRRPQDGLRVNFGSIGASSQRSVLSSVTSPSLHGDPPIMDFAAPSAANLRAASAVHHGGPSYPHLGITSAPPAGLQAPTISDSIIGGSVRPLANDVDAWIDELDINRVDTPFGIARGITQDVTMAWLVQQTLPRIQIPEFDGSPLLWVEFVTKFRDMVHNPVYLNDCQRKNYLLQSLRREAKRAVRGFSNDGKGYVLSLKRLKFLFGQKSKIAEAALTKVTQGKILDSDDHAGLSEFYYTISDCLVMLDELRYDSDLFSSDTLRQAAKRLPLKLHNKWAEHCLAIRRRNEDPNLIHLGDWLQARVLAQKELPEQNRSKKKDPPPRRQENHTNVTLKNSSSSISTPKKGCLKCGERHKTWKCRNFKNMSPKARFKLVDAHKLCINCLNDGHSVEDCSSKNTCFATGCSQKHHTSLHGYYVQGEGDSTAKDGKDAEPAKEDAGNHKEDTDPKVCGMMQSRPKTVYMQVVPVKLHSDRTSLVTYGILDTCSGCSFVREDVADSLGLQGKKCVLPLGTVIDDARDLLVPEVSLDVSAVDGDESFPIEEAYILPTEKFKMPAQPCPPDLSEAYTHLEGIDVVPVSPNQITILIGANVPEAHLQLEVRKGSRNQPWAINTPFGWTLFGTSAATAEGLHGSFHSMCTTLNEVIHPMVEGLWEPHKKIFCNLLIGPPDPLEDTLLKFWEQEHTAILPSKTVAMSKDDQRAMAFLENETKFDGKKYVVPMLWENPSSILPNDYFMAKKRFDLLCQRMRADSNLYESYKAKLDHYLERGFARRLSAEEARNTSSRTWYLPHHPVFNPNKPGKLRVVKDAAAKFQGKSLNQALITGPDLLNSLVGIIIRFRIGNVAVIADLEEFFHHVGVTADDADSLRYLWKDDIFSDGPPHVMQMLVHIFGAKDSVTCTIHALQQTARDHHQDFDPLTYWTILFSFYVDDLLQSYSTDEIAISMIQELIACTSRGGFHLTKWMSNSRKVLESLPQTEVSPKLVFELDSSNIERALGMLWDMNEDVLMFAPNFKVSEPSKRGILKVTSSLFDPPGFVAPFILPAKLLIQEAWRTGCDWDSPLNSDMEKRWNRWLKNAENLASIRLPRRYHTGNVPAIETQLHIFCDASELAFGCVAYLRLTFKDNSHQCVMVMAKSRLAPLKTISIPRLELNGAVVAARLYRFLVHQIDLPIEQVWFWTDSTLVLQYVANERQRFKTYVANRVTEILETIPLNSFRHVPGKLNPADLLTRGVADPANLMHEDEQGTGWFTGPKFLRNDEDDWSMTPIPSLDDNDIEIKTKSVLVALGIVNQNLPVVNPLRYSSWMKLSRIVGWVLRWVSNLKSRICGKPDEQKRDVVLTPSEITDSRLLIVKDAQREAFDDVLMTLRSGEALPTNHKIVQLCPFIDHSGALRVGGRLKHAPIPTAAKHPLILPKQHHVTNLIIDNEHRSNGHIGTEHVLANLRQSYWIVNGRTAIKALLRRCFFCQVRRAKKQYPYMANLPPGRMAYEKPPFANCGVDLCGHFFIKQGKKRLKRWVVLYTCLTVRCVHLEVVDGADTDSFIMSLRRFVNRRGAPEIFYSDCGSNFKGATKELKDVISELDHEAISTFASNNNIVWSYNPPAAPHMGGVWERLVRSVKEVLTGMMEDTAQRLLTDPQLATLLTEVESILNTRPLTHASEDINDLDALTPNHILLGLHRHWDYMGDITENDVLSRRRWKQVHALRTMFWNRWRREYLPTLTKRTRWNQPGPNYRIGELVLLDDDDSRRGKWPLGRITNVLPGKDGIVRVVELRTKDGTYTRPVVKLRKLEESEVPQGEGNIQTV